MPKLTMPPYPGPFANVFREIAEAWRLPVAFIYALAWSETRNKPDAVPPPAANSSACGMFQILNVTRERFNKATGANLTRADMLDPKKCGTVAAYHLRKEIIPAYVATGVKELQEDWNNPFFVAMVFLGYTAGWSPQQGVALLVPKLVKAGAKNLTVELVTAAAGKVEPESFIYVDPKLLKPNAKKKMRGPYMSDPKLATHINDEVKRYQFIREQVASEKPVDRSTLAKFIDNRPKLKKVAVAAGVLGVVGLALSMGRGGR